MTFQKVLEILRDGKRYIFSRPGIAGHFHKAPFPAQALDTKLDGSLSAITYYIGTEKASPVLTLYDFDEDDWYCREVEGRY